MNSTLEILNSHNAVLASGFALGCLYGFRFSCDYETSTSKYTFEIGHSTKPLSRFFSSVIGGVLTCLTAALISKSVPENLKILFPIAFAGYALYKLKKKYTNKKD